MPTSRRAVVTGASGDIGTELAAGLAKDGWTLVLLNRSREKSAPLLERIRQESPQAQVSLVVGDLANHDSIATAAGTINEGGHVDLLIHNAGVLLGERRYSPQHIEMHAQVNVLAPYLLTRMLTPSLAGSTVVGVSTGGISRAGPLRVDQLADPAEVKKLTTYSHSKLAAAALLHAFAAMDGTTTFRSADPGAVKTQMSAGEGAPVWIRALSRVAFSSPQTAAARILTAAALPPPVPNGALVNPKGTVAELPASATDPATQADLLAWCAQATGVPASS